MNQSPIHDLMHIDCRFADKACGGDCPVAVEKANAIVRERIEAISQGGVSVVVDNEDGSISFSPNAHGVLPTGDIFRARTRAAQPMNRRARRAEAARARHG